MKKIIYVFVILLMSFISMQVYANESNKVLKIFQADAKQLERMWYLEKDNNIYVCIGYDNTLESNLYKYENKKLVTVPMSIDEEYKFRKEYEIEQIDDSDIKKKDLGNNKYLILKRVGESYTDYYMTIEENGKERDISKERYMLFAFGNYGYIDKKYQKIYVFCRDRKKKRIGLYVYDITVNTFKEFHVIKEDEDKVLYSDPVRIPNTPYLMFKGINTPTDWGMYIEEIPEWKAEIENQNKEDKEVKEKKYIIDGPANIREKPKGKTIGSIEDGAEVKILREEEKWYEVERKGIKGWTYKENVKEKQAEK